MTVENCIKLLEAYKKQVENPKTADGRELSGEERKNVIAQSKKNIEMMTKHILNSRKFRGHPIIEELTPKPKQEKKENGKKSKR